MSVRHLLTFLVAHRPKDAKDVRLRSVISRLQAALEISAQHHGFTVKQYTNTGSQLDVVSRRAEYCTTEFIFSRGSLDTRRGFFFLLLLDFFAAQLYRRWHAAA